LLSETLWDYSYWYDTKQVLSFSTGQNEGSGRVVYKYSGSLVELPEARRRASWAANDDDDFPVKDAGGDSARCHDQQ
jgi:hypothetical protein